MPGDELVQFRLECSMSMYEQSTDILDQARFEHDFQTIVVRFQVRSSTVCYDLVRLNTNLTFTGFTYSPTDFCSIPYDFFTILTRLCSLADFMCGCIYGLVRSLTVLYDR